MQCALAVWHLGGVTQGEVANAAPAGGSGAVLDAERIVLPAATPAVASEGQQNSVLNRNVSIQSGGELRRRVISRTAKLQQITDEELDVDLERELLGSRLVSAAARGGDQSS